MLKQTTLIILLCSWTMLHFPLTLLAQPEPQQRKIGILLPLSGTYGDVGAQVLDALRLAMPRNSGPAWIMSDTAGDPEQSAAAVLELCSMPDVLAIIGPVGQKESKAAAIAAQECGIPILTLSSSFDIEQSGAFVFRFRTTPTEQAQALAKFSISEGYSNFLILAPDDFYGWEATKAFWEEIRRLGGQISGAETYEPSSTNFDKPVQLLTGRKIRTVKGHKKRLPRVKAKGAKRFLRPKYDAIFIPDYHSTVGLILPFLDYWEVPLKSLGGSVALLGLSGWNGEGLKFSEGLAAEAYFTTLFGRQMTSTSEDFYDLYSELYGREPSELEAQSFDAMSYLLSCLARTRGPITRTLLKTMLEQPRGFRGLAGPIMIDKKGALQREIHIFTVDGLGLTSPY